MEIKKGHYVSRVWFLGGRDDFDVMAYLWRVLPDGEWRFDYRFRYYQGERNAIFDSEDRKSRWTATFPANATETAALRAAGKGMLVLSRTARMTMSCIPIESDEPEDFIAKLRDQPWFYAKVDGGPDA